MYRFLQALAFTRPRSIIYSTTPSFDSLFDTLLSAQVMVGHNTLCTGLLTFLAAGLACQAVAANLAPPTVQACSLFSMWA